MKFFSIFSRHAVLWIFIPLKYLPQKLKFTTYLHNHAIINQIIKMKKNIKSLSFFYQLNPSKVESKGPIESDYFFVTYFVYYYSIQLVCTIHIHSCTHKYFSIHFYSSFVTIKKTFFPKSHPIPCRKIFQIFFCPPLQVDIQYFLESCFLTDVII